MVASFITVSDHRFSKIPLNISKIKWDYITLLHNATVVFLVQYQDPIHFKKD